MRSLTGKSGSSKKAKASEPGLLNRGLSVIEDRSEKVSLSVFSFLFFVLVVLCRFGRRFQRRAWGEVGGRNEHERRNAKG